MSVGIWIKKHQSRSPYLSHWENTLSSQKQLENTLLGRRLRSISNSTRNIIIYAIFTHFFEHLRMNEFTHRSLEGNIWLPHNLRKKNQRNNWKRKLTNKNITRSQTHFNSRRVLKEGKIKKKKFGCEVRTRKKKIIFTYEERIKKKKKD